MPTNQSVRLKNVKKQKKKLCEIGGVKKKKKKSHFFADASRVCGVAVGFAIKNKQVLCCVSSHRFYFYALSSPLGL